MPARTGRAFPSRQSLGPRPELAATVPPPVLPTHAIVADVRARYRRAFPQRQARQPVLATVVPAVVTTPVQSVFVAHEQRRWRRPPDTRLLTSTAAATYVPPVFPAQTIFQAHEQRRWRRPPNTRSSFALGSATYVPPPVPPQTVFVARGRVYRRPYQKRIAFPVVVSGGVFVPIVTPTKPLVVSIRGLSLEYRNRRRRSLSLPAIYRAPPPIGMSHTAPIIVKLVGSWRRRSRGKQITFVSPGYFPPDQKGTGGNPRLFRFKIRQINNSPRTFKPNAIRRLP